MSKSARETIVPRSYGTSSPFVPKCTGVPAAVVDVVGPVVEAGEHDAGKIVAGERREQDCCTAGRRRSAPETGSVPGDDARNAVAGAGIGEIRNARVQTSKRSE